MEQVAPKPDWGKRVAGVLALLVAVIAGAGSLAMNVKYGWSADPFLGIAFGMGDVTKLTLLVVCTCYLGWARQWKVVFVACVALSLFCATNFILDMRGQDRLDRASQTQSWEGAQADLARIRDQLGKIAETGDAAALAAQADAAKARADAAKARADDEARSGRGPRWTEANSAWEAAVREEAKLRGRAGEARRRDELKAELKAAKAAASATGGPAEVSGLARAISGGGLSPEQAAARLDMIATIFAILVSEFATWLAAPGVKLLAESRKPAGRQRGQRAEPKTPAPEPEKPKRGTAAYYLARLKEEHPELARAVERGELKPTAAAVKAGWRQPPKSRAKAAPAAVRQVEGTPEAVNNMLAQIAGRARKKTGAAV